MTKIKKNVFYICVMEYLQVPAVLVDGPTRRCSSAASAL